MLRGDTVKDDSGAYAVFTEQGSSASQMTAAKKWMLSQDYQVVTGQAADAVSAYTQVKLEDAPRLLKIPLTECPDVVDTSSTTQMAQIMGKHWRSRGTSCDETCMVIH